jgi:hypothetical protein
MFNMTENEPTVGWSQIQPTIHPQNTLLTLSLAAWKLSQKMVDDERDWQDITRMQQTAIDLERLMHDDCTCTPINECEVCNTVARLIYDEDYIKESK